MHSISQADGAGPSSAGVWLDPEPGSWPSSIAEWEGRMGVGGMHWVANGGRYKQRSKASELLPFRKWDSRPLPVTFFDGLGLTHRVMVDTKPISLVVPLAAQVVKHIVHQYKGIEWIGEDAKKTLLDPKCSVVECQFSYEPERAGRFSAQPHGVRVDVVAWELDLADPARREEMEQSEEDHWRALQAEIHNKLDPRSASLRRHGTLEVADEVEVRAEMGRMILQRALWADDPPNVATAIAAPCFDQGAGEQQTRAEMGRALLQVALFGPDAAPTLAPVAGAAPVLLSPRTGIPVPTEPSANCAYEVRSGGLPAGGFVQGGAAGCGNGVPHCGHSPAAPSRVMLPPSPARAFGSFDAAVPLTTSVLPAAAASVGWRSAGIPGQHLSQ